MKKHLWKVAVLILAVAAVWLWRGISSPDVQIDVELYSADLSVILERCDAYIQSSDFSQRTKNHYDSSEYHISQITEPMIKAIIPEREQAIPPESLVVVFPNRDRTEVPTITLVLSPDAFEVLGFIPAI